MKEKIINILVNGRCDNCEYNNWDKYQDDICDNCHKKYQKWKLSEDTTVTQIAEQIIRKINNAE